MINLSPLEKLLSGWDGELGTFPLPIPTNPAEWRELFNCDPNNADEWLALANREKQYGRWDVFPGYAYFALGLLLAIGDQIEADMQGFLTCAQFERPDEDALVVAERWLQDKWGAFGGGEGVGHYLTVQRALTSREEVA